MAGHARYAPKDMNLFLRRVFLAALILLIGFATATIALVIADDLIFQASDAMLILAVVAGALAGILPVTLLVLTRWKGTILPVLKVFLSALVGWLVYVAFIPQACNESFPSECWSFFGNEVEDSTLLGLAPAAIAAGATWVILTLAATWRQNSQRAIG